MVGRDEKLPTRGDEKGHMMIVAVGTTCTAVSNLGSPDYFRKVLRNEPQSSISEDRNMFFCFSMTLNEMNMELVEKDSHQSNFRLHPFFG